MTWIHHHPAWTVGGTLSPLVRAAKVHIVLPPPCPELDGNLHGRTVVQAAESHLLLVAQSTPRKVDAAKGREWNGRNDMRKFQRFRILGTVLGTVLDGDLHVRIQAVGIGSRDGSYAMGGVEVIFMSQAVIHLLHEYFRATLDAPPLDRWLAFFHGIAEI